MNSKSKISNLISKEICYEGDADRAEIFSSQFSDVFIDDNGTLPPDVPTVVESIEDIVFDRDAIFKSLKGLKQNSAPGPDNLPARLFKLFPWILSMPLQKIFQASYDQSILPDDWKTATVVPIFKNKGKRSDPTQYRPISLTSICCKIFERSVKTFLNEFITKHNIISEHQHGFLSKKSTQTQLLECSNNWTYWVDKREGVDVVYLDISKAFDSVSHSKLLHKLQKYGIRGKFFNCIKSFLEGRTQRVKVNSSFSKSSHVKSGVPQGSVLGPLLFLLYINDVVGSLKNCSIKIFADDCKVYFCIKKFDGYLKLLHDICNIFDWMDANQLKIAMEKCVVLHMGPTNPHRSYVVNGETLPTNSTMKDLGIMVSSDLKFSDHCVLVSKKAFLKLNLLFKACISRDRAFLLATFFSYVRPILEFNCSVWSPYLIKDIDQIEKVQKRFTKRVPGLQNLPYKERLKSLKLQSLELRRLIFDLVQCYKIVHNIDCLKFEDFFTFANVGPRDHSLKLASIPLLPKKQVRIHYFSCKIVKIWNFLTEKEVTAPTLESFKKLINSKDLSKFLIGTYLK